LLGEEETSPSLWGEDKKAQASLQLKFSALFEFERFEEEDETGRLQYQSYS